jgi:hypothetical protein
MINWLMPFKKNNRRLNRESYETYAEWIVKAAGIYSYHSSLKG